MKVLSVFGTRPEAVKMAPVIKALSSIPDVESLICVTAQHRQMLDQVLDLFSIQPDVDLDIMHHDQTLAQLTGNIFISLAPILERLAPDWVLVQGDTTTVMAASMLAFYHQVRVGHIEAGLRTHDKWQPFPEEINRRVTSVVADLHFAPTAVNRENLLREGVEDWRIRITGNTVVDALYEISKRKPPEGISLLLDRLGITSGERELILVTAHRRENLGKPLEEICKALKDLALRYQQTHQFVYPVHLNPKVRNTVYHHLTDMDNLHLLPPQDYLPMVQLMRRAKIILTDSGGIQEEATALGIPTLVLRDVTERPEGVDAGILKLVGTDRKVIVTETIRLLEDKQHFSSMSRAGNPYGDGHAAERIVSALLDFTGRPIKKE